jgi:hypothetical protein
MQLDVSDIDAEALLSGIAGWGRCGMAKHEDGVYPSYQRRGWRLSSLWDVE